MTLYIKTAHFFQVILWPSKKRDIKIAQALAILQPTKKRRRGKKGGQKKKREKGHIQGSTDLYNNLAKREKSEMLHTKIAQSFPVIMWPTQKEKGDIHQDSAVLSSNLAAY